MLGNILIALVVLSYGGLVNLTAKPMPGGDYGVGYAFTWLVAAGVFAVSSGLLVWNMNHNQGFDWAPNVRNWMLLLAWVAFAFAVVSSLELRTKRIEGEFLPIMRWLTMSKAFLWLPALMIIPALYLLNAQRPAGFAPVWVKIPMQAGFFVSLVMCGTVLFGYVKSSVLREMKLSKAAAEQKALEGNNSWSFNQSMKFIGQYQEKSVHGLLRYTHREQDERLRNAALEKIKTYPDWEAELVDTLNQGALNEAYWVVAFLDGNNPEHSENFILPLKKSIDRFIPGLQESLKNPNDITLGYINIEALCRVLETHFKGKEEVFKPGMEKLQKALQANAPARGDKSTKQWFDDTLSASRTAVSNWLEATR